MRRLPRSSLPARQRGAALLILLALFATAAAYLLVSSLNKSSVALSLTRADKNRLVMQEAKAALIAWAASETSQPTSGQGFQPGALPCPDADNNGTQDYSGPTTCTTLLGRLPWASLNVADLRDASGERLWYAVSSNFVRSTSNIINSDSQGQLTISGLAPASNVVAVVLAPGMRLGNQDRGAIGINTASNYLENNNGVANSTNFVTAIENLTDPLIANLFNDQLLVITQQDLMSVVEPVVAARIRRDIVLQYIYNSDPTLTDSSNVWSDNSSNRNKSRYFDAWGAFPFAAPFSNPGSSSFTGVAGTYEGLLPVVANLSYIWSSGSVVQTGGSGSVSSTSCTTINSSTNLKCNITYSGGAPTIRMSGIVDGVGRSFVQLAQLSDVSTPGGTSARSLSGSLDGAGAGIVMLDATLRNRAGNTTINITINNGSLIASPLISTADSFAGWFNRNQWYKQTYYAVSPGYAPGGAGSCNPWGPPPNPPSNPPSSPQCLSVANLTSPYANPTTDTRATLILAGRSLSGATRPNGTPSDYLEGQNATTGDYSFEHGLAKTTTTLVAGSPVAITINDRVTVVAP